MLKVILVASGKGGTGKTSLTAGIRCGARRKRASGARHRRRLRPSKSGYRAGHVRPGGLLVCRCGRRHGAARGRHGASSRVRDAVPATRAGQTARSERARHGPARKAGRAGRILIISSSTSPAGLPAEMSFLAHIATQAIIVTATDRACVRGAERCARTIEQEYCIQRIRMVLNRVRSEAHQPRPLGQHRRRDG